MDYNYSVDPAALQAEIAKHSGGIPGLGDQFRPQAGNAYMLRFAPPYKPLPGNLPFQRRKVHRNVFTDGQPHVCLGEFGSPCPSCIWQKQYRNDGQLGELSNKRFAATIAWIQVLDANAMNKGWQPWRIGNKEIAKIDMVLSTYPTCLSAAGGRFFNASFGKTGDRGQWTELIGLLPLDPSPIPVEYLQHLKNLDIAWRLEPVERIQEALRATPMPAQPAPGGGSTQPPQFNPGAFPSGGGSSGFPSVAPVAPPPAGGFPPAAPMLGGGVTPPPPFGSAPAQPQQPFGGGAVPPPPAPGQAAAPGYPQFQGPPPGYAPVAPPPATPPPLPLPSTAGFQPAPAGFPGQPPAFGGGGPLGGGASAAAAPLVGLQHPPAAAASFDASVMAGVEAEMIRLGLKGPSSGGTPQ